MAMSLGCSWSTIVPGDASLTRSSSSSSSSSPTLRVSLPTHQANLRKLSSKTCAASPKPAATTPVKREPRGIMKPKPISAEMQELLGVPEIPRTQALKKIWEYIKEHNLQDPENKKIIVCDEKLKKIFAGRERVGFLEISGLMNPHFIK